MHFKPGSDITRVSAHTLAHARACACAHTHTYTRARARTHTHTHRWALEQVFDHLGEHSIPDTIRVSECVCVCVCVNEFVWMCVYHHHTCVHTNPTNPTQSNPTRLGTCANRNGVLAGNAHTTYDPDVGGGGATLLLGISIAQGWGKWCATYTMTSLNTSTST